MALHRFLRLVVMMAVAGWTAWAHAQGAPSGSALPILGPLHKAPLGAWASYDVTVDGMPPMKQKIALVGRTADSDLIEMTLDGGPLGGASMVLALTFDADPKLVATTAGKPRRVVLQLANNDPMEAPVDGAMGAGKLRRVDPKTLGKPENVSVPGGTFKARRHTEKGDDGAFDSWLAEDAAPLGLVKLTGAGTTSGQQLNLTLTLAAHGKGAKPTIVRPALPYDQNKLMQQMVQATTGVKAGKP